MRYCQACNISNINHIRMESPGSRNVVRLPAASQHINFEVYLTTVIRKLFTKSWLLST